MSFHFINVVWGESYTHLFLDHYLPTQLSPNNLPKFYSLKGATYKLYTPPRYRELILQHPTYQKLCQTISTELKIFNIPKSYFKYSHQVMNYCHQHSVIEASLSDAVMVFLSPDSIWSDGSFSRLLELYRQGKRLVMINGIRIEKEKFIDWYINNHSTSNQTSVIFSSRELAKIALDNLHPIHKSYFVDSEYFNEHPAHLYWKFNDSGILGRCFHLHPLMIYPKEHKVLPNITIDADYISYVSQPENLYIVDDSDEIFCCEISPKDLYQEWWKKCQKLEINKLKQWIDYHTTDYHRQFVKTKIRIHADDLSDDWYQIEQASDQLLEQLITEKVKK